MAAFQLTVSANLNLRQEKETNFTLYQQIFGSNDYENSQYPLENPIFYGGNSDLAKNAGNAEID